jgi:hypothetical protein
MQHKIVTAQGNGYTAFPQPPIIASKVSNTTAQLGLLLNTAELQTLNEMDNRFRNDDISLIKP